MKLGLELPHGYVIHPAIIEWNRWRTGDPTLMTYAKLGDMPYSLSISFEYLVRKYGKNGLTTGHEQLHNEFVSEEISRVNSVRT